MKYLDLLQNPELTGDASGLSGDVSAAVPGRLYAIMVAIINGVGGPLAAGTADIYALVQYPE